jgi:hypothetical protein
LRAHLVERPFGGAHVLRADLVQREETANLVAHAGRGCVVPPEAGASVSTARVAGPEVGAQLSELTSLTGQVGRAGGALSEAGGDVAGVLAAVGLPAGPASTVQATGEWALQAAGGLRRRLGRFGRADRAGGMLTARQAGYGLFACWLPGESGLGALLDLASGGGKAALASLLQRENAATSSDLAIAVNTWWGT